MRSGCLLQQPITGDFDGDGVSSIAVFSGTRAWVDANNNGRWDGASIDRVYDLGVGGNGTTLLSGQWQRHTPLP